MSDFTRFKMGDLRVGDVVELNMAYVVVRKDFNLFAEVSKMRYFYPKDTVDDLPTYLVSRDIAYRLLIEKDGTINHLGKETETIIGVVEGPFKREDHPIKDFNTYHHSYLIDWFTPPREGLVQLDTYNPVVKKLFSTKVFTMTASLVDRRDDHAKIINEVLALTEDATEDDKEAFVTLVESMYASNRIDMQLSVQGFTTLGKGESDENDAVFYTLGLYDSKVGRDLLYVCKKIDLHYVDLFKQAAQMLHDGGSIEEVNEVLKKDKCSIAVRNIKTYPKYAFDHASKKVPVLGVLSFITPV